MINREALGIKPLGLYIHIPFCQTKCGYCDFPSWAGQEALMEPYAKALVQEIRARAALLSHPLVDTVFIGGGTPTHLKLPLLMQVLTALFDSFPMTRDAEISCEANPGTVSLELLQALRQQGVNRLSIGAQSANPGELAILERLHQWPMVEEAVGLAREAGFANINIDLMLGLPGQSQASLMDSLAKALALSPQHLSCYSLILEEGTPLHQQVVGGKVSLPGEDLERSLDALARRVLKQAGYQPYEISNHALPGFACRHNQNCWRYYDYLGFGSAAAGFYQGQRRRNPEGILDYINGQAPQQWQVSDEEGRFEMLMLGLRLGEGLDLLRFEQRFGSSLEQFYPAALQKNLASGLLVQSPGRLSLSPRGQALMNQVLLDFMPD